ncbi:AP2-like ethylene-responsive transcription factor AIL6 [Vigna unguiculata]|uniref:AP2-like ethylene-responsive transcription factor AIL6 n=1 Tax=Vigna unguiculata TaxID=3917 RepID=UPI001016F394|nr:AP2-like ethylene-responsive transcription factor AIL6 [Vigna unguiculata]XP_027917546.1 AP2-like ethylene-responsive transcription factor AIL6 [Vigna unguiculata]
MAGATNWLTFSLTPMEMLRSPDSSSHCMLDNFYATNGWTNSKGLMDSESENQPLVVPKVEDFLENQTETQQDDSSLTQIYDHGSAAVYFGDQQDLNAIPGFQPFSGTNSSPELDDSASDKTTRVAPAELGAHSGESSKGALSLCDAAAHEKAIIAVEFATPKKVSQTIGQRTSIYRGVTRHRWTGRYEAHLWDNSCRREGQARKGRQVYLGGYDKEEKAARAYDLAAIKYWGPTATTNFPISNYTKELEEMKHAGKQEFIASLRRKSSGFSRGASAYRGVTRHHQQGRWQARIGRVAGNKDLYLGTFATEEEAAEAYDIAAIKFRGASAVTNFEMNRYDVENILNSSLPVGGVAKRLKLSSPESEKKNLVGSTNEQPQGTNESSTINFSAIQPVASIPYDSANAYPQNLLHHFHHSSGGSSSVQESAAIVTNATSLTILPPPPVPGFFLWPPQSF